MTQMSSIQEAISAQIARVDAIRRALQPLPGNLHHMINSNKVDSKHATESAVRYMKRSITTGKPFVSPPVINNAMRLIQCIGMFKKEHPEALAGDMMTTDGVSLGITREPDTQDTVSIIESFPEAVAMVLNEARVLSHDVTFISSDIVDLISSASTSLDNEAIRMEDLIAPSGFCYLEKPIVTGDYHPETGEFSNELMVGWRGFSWEVGKRDGGEYGITFIIYSDYGCFRHIFLPSLHATTGEDISDHMVDSSVFRDDDLLACDLMYWAMNTPWTTGGPITATEQAAKLAKKDGTKVTVVNPQVALFRKFFLTMMRFCWQELLVSEPAVVPRPLRRAAVRQLGQDMTMNILRLRRVKHSSGNSTGEGSRLDHRIVVRGHWRNQHYPKFGPAYLDDGTYNDASHRRIWIDPHIKGPEDAPFLTKHKINALVR